MVVLTDEQAQQIEEALEDIVRVFKFETGTPVEALATIRAARAEQEKQEPVAIVKENPFCPEGRSDELNVYLPVGTKLYAAPVEPVKQEPVAWMLEGSNCVEFEYRDYHDGDEWTPLYAAPVRAQDLTDDEIDEIYQAAKTGNLLELRRAVIAADRKLNGVEK